MELNMFKMDSEKELNGVWFPVDNGRMLIARIGNQKFAKAMERLTKPYQVLIKAKKMPDAEAENILCEAIAEGILLDWEGMTMDGEDFPYNNDNVIAALKVKSFRELVVSLAQETDAYREEDKAEQLKNS